MNRRLIMLVILISALLQTGFSQELQERIKNLPGVISVEKMINNPFFKEAYVIMIRQPLDHQHPEFGYFPQRIILSHIDYQEPLILITEGYNGNNGIGPRYLNELCPMLYANQLFVEHRYFGKSVPDTLKWQYLTVENSAADHHHINQLFKTIYPGKWIATGISKGGQASLYYRLLYPDDVKETVAYVAPLNFKVEEKRHDRYIRHQIGTREDRKAVLNFQKEVLKRKKRLLPLFENYCREKKYVFNASLNEIYDYCVLEYSFSFWQWCYPVKSIPSVKATDKEILNHFIKVISPNYFDQITGRVVMPFFVQALHQLGYYAYNTKPFGRLMQLKNTRGYLARLFVPKEAVFPYDASISYELQNFLKHRAEKILLIYGDNDPWSASAANTGGNKNICKIVKKGGCHLTRINNLTPEQQTIAIDLIKKWLN